MRITWEDGAVRVSGGGSEFTFDRATGRLREAARGAVRHRLTDLLADAGVDGAYARGQMAYYSLYDKRTW